MRKIFFIFLFIIVIIFPINKVFSYDEIIKTETDDKIIFVKDKDGGFSYSWTFDKKDDLKEDSFSFNKEINIKTKDLYDIDNLIGNERKKMLFSFEYHGDLPSKSTIKASVGNNFKDGSILSLYSYDEENRKIEKIDDNIKVINGSIAFDIDYCTDYFVVLHSKENVNYGKNNGILIIGMIIVIVGFIGYIMFSNK